MEIFNWTPINGATERSEVAPPGCDGAKRESTHLAVERREIAPPSPRGVEERSDGAPSLRSSEARSPPRRDRAKRGSTQLATERSEGANTRLKMGP